VTYWKQRDKHRDVREGDANTRFFHAQACQWLRRNNIRVLDVGGVVVSSHQDKTAALSAHLRRLLGAHIAATGHLDLAVLYTDSATVDTTSLVAPFSELEARTAVKSMNRHSCPRLDGFGPGFYVVSWPTVAPAVMVLAHSFHDRTTELERLNRSYVVLIPKHDTTMKPGDYRPICLQNCSLKIVCKIYAHHPPTV
jgi:hypothetical protein